MPVRAVRAMRCVTAARRTPDVGGLVFVGMTLGIFWVWYGDWKYCIGGGCLDEL